MFNACERKQAVSYTHLLNRRTTTLGHRFNQNSAWNEVMLREAALQPMIGFTVEGFDSYDLLFVGRNNFVNKQEGSSVRQ